MVQIKKAENFSEWYLETILKADLVDYGPVKGTIVFKPYAYRMWEKLQNYLDQEIKKLDVKNAYFPIFIPESFLKKEKEHFEGFTPEVAVVTYAGGEELSEKLIVRPTSETIMYHFFAKWIKSYRDLPLMINQWSNVIRWEKRPFPFFRNTEFLWQEGHTAHRTHKEALNFALKALAMYQKIYQEVLCVYGIPGQKSASEKFAGALATYTYEILMPDGKALQGCTSHDLGQNFSRVFEIRFQDKDKKLKYAWQTSWGFTTRSLGATIAVHGDDYGLVLPPKISPYQIVIIPIYNQKNQKKIKKNIENLMKELKNYEIYFDDSDHSPGYKFNEWELKGVPLRIEIGQKEITTGKLTVFRRDKRERFSITFEDLKNNLENIFKEMENYLWEKSKKFTETKSFPVNSFDEFKKIMKTQKGFIQAYWCEKEACEIKIKEETKATTRCLPLTQHKFGSGRTLSKNVSFKGLNLKGGSSASGKCVYCGKKAKNLWLFAQAY